MSRCFLIDVPAYLTILVHADDEDTAKKAALGVAAELEQATATTLPGPCGPLRVRLSLDEDPVDREPYVYAEVPSPCER